MNEPRMFKFDFDESIVKKSSSYDFWKRVIDIIGALIGLVLTFPIICIFTGLVAIESPGHPLYMQERLGKQGEKFNIVKIRSMYIDAEKDGATWAAKNDSRVTKIGKFIRKTRVDELPQLFNILTGSMSIVGPRPERLIFAEEFEKMIPGFNNRLLVKPGLTGWAQVNGGYEIEPKEKLEYDLHYIQNRSIFFDFKIMIMTIKVIITGEGAR